MIKEILLSSYQKLLDSPKLVKLTLATSITHSLIFVLTVIYNLYFFLENKFAIDNSNQVVKYIYWLFQIEGIWRKAIVIAIVIWLGYFVLSPVWDSMVISHLWGKNSIRANFRDGIKYYYKMLEYDATVALFNFIIFFNLFSKLFVYDIANGVLIGIMSIWFLATLFVFVMFQYIKYIIVFEETKVWEAIMRSINYSIENLWLTIKLTIANIVINLRLIINLIFMVWIPIWLIYVLHLAWRLWSLNNNIIYLLFVIIVWFLAYINSLIDAYFKTYRYQAYLKVSWKEAELDIDNKKDEDDIYKDNLFNIGSNTHIVWKNYITNLDQN